MSRLKGILMIMLARLGTSDLKEKSFLSPKTITMENHYDLEI